MAISATVYTSDNHAICEYGSMGLMTDDVAIRSIRACFEMEFPSGGYICRVSRKLSDGSLEPFAEWVS